MKNGAKPIPHYRARITDGFWRSRQELNRDVTIYAVYDRFKETGRFDALKCLWKEEDGEESKPHHFWDSDVAKWIEGAALILRTHKSEKLEELCDSLIEDIVTNQGEDGYFNSYMSVAEPELRFKERDRHELYCAGHLMEAAVAYYESTGKRRLLDAMCRFADYIELRFKLLRDTDFITPGHEEIEIALFKLYECTGEHRYYELAEFFIEQRGRADRPIGVATLEYNQSHAPVRKQRRAVGHAVRATYLYTAMATLAGYTGDEELIFACRDIFDDIATKKMYVTGGIGSSASGEAFTVDYDLPNVMAYSESCAAMGLIFFAQRMLALESDSKYSDVIERVLYNNFLSVTSLDGKSFFYTNPLEVMPYLYYKDTVSSFYKIKYPKPSRAEVFKTSCCPSNIVRVVPTLQELIFGEGEDRLYLHQYISSECDTVQRGKSLHVTVKTDFPTSGKVRVSVQGGELSLAVRIPSWHKGNEWKTQHGYAYMTVKEGEEVTFSFDMTPYFVEANPRSLYTAGKCAVCRGPVVYCSESVDNGELLRNTQIDPTSPIELCDDEGYAAPTLTVGGYRRVGCDGELYTQGITSELVPTRLKLIPYHAFANRGECEMLLWHNVRR